MYLQKIFSKKTGKTQLLMVHGFRENGKVKHKVIENFGYLEDWYDKYDDPLSHFTEVVKTRNEEESAFPKTIEVKTTEKLTKENTARKNLGYAAIKAVYEQLGLYDFFKQKQRYINSEFNLNKIFSLLVFERFIAPSSILHSYYRKDKYFEDYKFSLDDIYRSLDYFWEYSNSIQKLLSERTKELFGRDNQLGYWDVTNYYFEIPYEDEDKVDDNGNIVKIGQKKRGPSKEHRKDPIVQMGLLMDSKGIPIAFNTFSGGESEKTNMLPAIRRVKRDYGMERIIVVADRALNTSDNTVLLAGKNDDTTVHNDGYLYGCSVIGAESEFKEWVLCQDDYTVTKETSADGETVYFKHKSRIEAKKTKLKNSKGTRNLNYITYQKQMVYYSEKYAKKQKKDRARAIAKANELIANPQRYNRATSYGVASYINNIAYDKETGEIIKNRKLELNQELISEQEKFDGYYAIVTSEKNMPDVEIRNIYKGLWEIEESFKIIKSEFKARPVFVRDDVHVNTHFLICYVALVIIRTLEHLLNESFTVKQIRDTIKSFSCSYLDQGYYMFDYRNEILDKIARLFGWNLSQKYMSTHMIRKILEHKGTRKI